ncbi:glycosyltransferase [Patulibacter sp.]|uniref:glycosyltransferase n=1 Tax=Patulibacter sp. TaxID=1912859 RepID=UPI002717A78F|nr:glycosyltransferase [Patulibacter sp.]MDO9409288.1 glycosyltransferase [Patulibacter sp.]
MSVPDPSTTPRDRDAPLRVCVVAEFYPRADDPVLGVWAHRQAVAARDAGAEVRVLVLHRPVPPKATRPRDLVRVLRRMRSQPREAELDGIPVTYVRFHSPPRGRSYGSWGRWAARPLRRALRRLHREFPFDVVHAHNAVPAGDAVRRACATGPLSGVPVIVSVHGGDVYYTARRSPEGERAVRDAFAGADLVLANSAGTADRCLELGAARTRVVRLGTDLPGPDAVETWHRRRSWAAPSAPDAIPGDPDAVAAPRRSRGRWGHGQVLRPVDVVVPEPLLVTVAHVVPRKRHEDVVRALWVLRDRHPGARYRVIGDGPERPALARLAEQLGVDDRIEWRGQLPHGEALESAREADLFVMPSVDEAFGVAYVEAMASAMPAVASMGEPGPQEISAVGEGIVLVPPGDVSALARALDALLTDPARRRTLGVAARRTVAESFTWERCGRQTLRAYRGVVDGGQSDLAATPGRSADAQAG